MAVAVIGPNAAHRRIVAKALAGSDARNVREYIDYPAKLTDVPRILEHRYDAILIDVDSDQSYALQIVEKIASAGTVIVMVYSRRNDPALLRVCLEAGARDFLPLPADPEPAEASAPQAHEPEPPPQEMAHEEASAYMPPPARVAAPIASVPTPMPAPAVSPMAAPALVPAVPQVDSQPSFAAVSEIAEPSVLAKTLPAEVPLPDSASMDFNAWDNAWIRATQPPAANPVDAKPRSGRLLETPAKSKRVTTPGPQKVSRPAEEAVAEAPASFGVDLGRTGDQNWKKMAFIAAGSGLIVGLLFLVFMRAPRHSAPEAATTEQPAAKSEAPSQMVVVPPPPAPAASKTTTKPSPMTPLGSAPAAEAQPAPVSSEMMDAQLSAPSRISGVIKKPAPKEDEPPPAGFAPSSMESGSVSASAFASHNNVTVAPVISAISAGVAAGMLIHKTEPVYPEFAKSARISGTVVLAARITKSGAIENLHIISGPEVLRNPALDAVRTWRYRPYKLNNQPVEVDTSIKVVFSLDPH
jgi:periplasmic protein TonB